MRKIISIALLVTFSLAISVNASAKAINLNSNAWLGTLKLDKKQLKSIKTAVEKSFTAPIDAVQQCGKVRSDCVVRAVREWSFQGTTYREIVVHLHTIGHTSRTVAKEKGKWPSVAFK